MTANGRAPWRFSMHGGHARESSAHGQSSLHELLDRAVAIGLEAYGLSQHAPVSDARFLYDDEREAGLDLDGRMAQFQAYASASAAAVEAYRDRIEVLRGLEAEVVPADSYATDTQRLRARFQFDYVVGSVHWVDDQPIDVSPGHFATAVERAGGLPALLARYYDDLAAMVEALRPEVLGHFDLPRLFSEGEPAHEDARVRAARSAALELIGRHGALLEVNTAGIRKGLGSPYPVSAVLIEGRDLGVRFTLSDDSHHVDHVGAGLAEGRAHLLSAGVTTVWRLRRTEQGAIERIEVPL